MSHLAPAGSSLLPADWFAHVPLVVLLTGLMLLLDSAALIPVYYRLRQGRDHTRRSQRVSGIKAILGFRHIPLIACIAALQLSISAFVLTTAVLRLPLYAIVLSTLLPWMPFIVVAALRKYKRHGAVALFAFIVLLQLGSTAEHSTQVAQLVAFNGIAVCPTPVDSTENAARAAALGLRSGDAPPTGLHATLVVQPSAEGWPAAPAAAVPVGCGIFGTLDIEFVHVLWALIRLLLLLWFVANFPRNTWLWLAVVFATYHALESLFIGWTYYVDRQPLYPAAQQVWATTVDHLLVTAHPAGTVSRLVNFYEAGGKNGLLASGGMIGSLLGINPILPTRPYLHLFTNLLITGLLALAFYTQIYRVSILPWLRYRLLTLNWSFVRSSLVLSVGMAAARVLGMLFSLVLARVLTPADYGYVQYNITVAGLIAIVTIPFGQHILALLVGQHRANPQQLDLYLSNAAVIFVGLTAFTLMASIPILMVSDRFDIGLLVIVIGTSLFYAYYGLARGFLDNLRLLFVYLGSNIIQLAATGFVYLVLKSRSATPAIVIYGASYFVPLLMAQHLIPLSFQINLGSFRRDVVSRIVRSFLPVFVSHIGYTVCSSLDILLVEHYLGSEVVGVYALNRTLQAVLSFIPTSISTLLMPRIAASPRHMHRRLLRHAIVWFLLANSGVIILFVLSYNWIVPRVFGVKYVVEPRIYLTMAVASIIGALQSLISAVFVGSNQARFDTLSWLVMAIVSVVVGGTLIPMNGLWGAALMLLAGSIASSATAAATYVLATRRANLRLVPGAN